MKRYNNIYEKIYDLDNLRKAHKNARKDKSFYKDVRMVDKNEDYYLIKIQNMLKNKTYKISKYTISIINDRGKERELFKLPYYPDRIIQWAIMLQLESIFVNTFCTHTCASISDRGIHKAIKLMDKYLKNKEETKYCFKMDVRKFYPNINHNILKQLLRRKFKDKDLLELLDKIIDSIEGNKGIPIGSYLSQFFANFYLSYFDHWLKENKKCKYVVRYMDDIVILDSSKENLHKIKDDIEEYFTEKLDIQIKDNWQIFSTKIRGIDFIGFRFFGNYKLLRKSTCKNFKRKMLKIKHKMNNKEELTYSEWCSVNSYKGWLKCCDSHRLYNKYIKSIEEYVNKYYINNIKNNKQ